MQADDAPNLPKGYHIYVRGLIRMQMWISRHWVLAALLVIPVNSALAWTPPAVGTACTGLKHAAQKWNPVLRNSMRQDKDLGRGSHSIKAQHVLNGGGPEAIGIAGNFMGGRALRDGIVDRKSFQSCFVDVSGCEHWIAVHAARYPLSPGIATCTPVRRR